MNTALIIFAKEPYPGRVKLRLARAIGSENAAELCRCFIADMLEMIRHLPVARKDLGYMPEDSRDYFRALVAPYLDISTFAQQGEDIGGRLEHAFQHQISNGFEHIIAVHTDTPTLPRAILERAFEALKSADVVIGPTFDGDTYLIGSRLPTSALFHGVPWGTQDVFKQITMNVINSGLSLLMLEPWYQVNSEHEYNYMRAHLTAMAHAGEKDLPKATLAWINSHK